MTGEPETKTSQLQMLPCVSLPIHTPPLWKHTFSYFLIVAQYIGAGQIPHAR